MIEERTVGAGLGADSIAPGKLPFVVGDDPGGRAS